MNAGETQPHRVGVVGLGGMGQYHAQCHLRTPSSRLVAVAEPDKEKLKAFRPELNLKRYRSAQELISDNEVSVIDICTPTVTHQELATSAARAQAYSLRSTR